MQTTDADTGQVAGMSRERYTDQVMAVLRAAIERTLEEYERAGTAAPAPASYAAALAGVLVPPPDVNPLSELLGPFWSSVKVRSALGRADPPGSRLTHRVREHPGCAHQRRAAAVPGVPVHPVRRPNHRPPRPGPHILRPADSRRLDLGNGFAD